MPDQPFWCNKNTILKRKSVKRKDLLPRAQILSSAVFGRVRKNSCVREVAKIELDGDFEKSRFGLLDRFYVHPDHR